MEKVDFIAGCLGGIAGVIVGHPLDTVKVRIQNDESTMGRGVLNRFKLIVTREGFRGLYKGVAPPMYSLGFINAIIFGVHGNVLRNLENPNSLQSHFLAGAVTGGVQSIVNGPIELLKIKMMGQGQGMKPGTPLNFSSSVDCMKKIFEAEGIFGLGRGMGITVLREVPAFGIYFVTFEWLCRIFTPAGSDSCPTSGLLMAGGIAGCNSWLCTSPIDVVKSRIQGDGEYKDGKFTYKYQGYMDCLRRSYRSEGWKVFFKGLNASLIRAFPTNAATFTVVAWSKRLLFPTE